MSQPHIPRERLATARKMPPMLCWVNLRKVRYGYRLHACEYKWRASGKASSPTFDCDANYYYPDDDVAKQLRDDWEQFRGDTYPEREGWEVRRRFVKINGPGEALLFLNAIGRFSPLTHRGPLHEGKLSFRQFCKLQEFTRHALLHPPEEWRFELLNSFSDKVREKFECWPDVAIAVHNGAPICFQNCESLVEVLATTLNLDKVLGTTYRFCAREDCGELFELGSQSSRIFCTSDCAHLIAVRRSRDKERKRASRRKR